MPQIIIIKERTAHFASYTFFTRDVDQYKNASLSQLYQPPRTPFSQNTYFRPVKTSRSSHLQMFFKIGVLKSFANFKGKHLRWSFFLKNLQGDSMQLHAKFAKFFLQHTSGGCFCIFFKKVLLNSYFATLL